MKLASFILAAVFSAAAFCADYTDGKSIHELVRKNDGPCELGVEISLERKVGQRPHSVHPVQEHLEMSLHPFLERIVVLGDLVEVSVRDKMIKLEQNANCPAVAENHRVYRVYAYQKFLGGGDVFYADAFENESIESTRSIFRFDLWNGKAYRALEHKAAHPDSSRYYPISPK